MKVAKASTLQPIFIALGAIIVEDAVLPIVASISGLVQTLIAHKTQSIQRLDEQDQVDHEIAAQKKTEEAGMNEGSCTHAIGFNTGDDVEYVEEADDDEEE